ncbi:BBP7 family outer membrane beta-barrel protein [Bradyrhizobium sp. UFLA05-153]
MCLRTLIAVASLLAASTASAQNRPIGFLTPSKNLVCQFCTDNGQGVLRCDIMEMEARPRRPADCELDWGHAFEMMAKGSAGRICAGDSVMDASLPVLAHGEVWQRAGGLIDTTVNPTLLPPGPPAGPNRPAQVLDTTNLLAQGFSFGVQYNY